jgi:hypothetical protein
MIDYTGPEARRANQAIADLLNNIVKRKNTGRKGGGALIDSTDQDLSDIDPAASNIYSGSKIS